MVTIMEYGYNTTLYFPKIAYLIVNIDDYI